MVRCLSLGIRLEKVKARVKLNIGWLYYMPATSTDTTFLVC